MKYFLSFGLIFFLFSCSGKEANTIYQDLETQEEDSIPENFQLIIEKPKTLSKKEMARELHGFWMGKNYLEQIEKTKSIYKARNYKTSIWAFTLDSTNLLSDSAFLNGFTDHEGGYGAFLKFNKNEALFESDPGRNEEFSTFQGKDFKLKIEQETLQFVFEKGENTELYRRVSDDQYELRRILF